MRVQRASQLSGPSTTSCSSRTAWGRALKRSSTPALSPLTRPARGRMIAAQRNGASPDPKAAARRQLSQHDRAEQTHSGRSTASMSHRPDARGNRNGARRDGRVTAPSRRCAPCIWQSAQLAPFSPTISRGSGGRGTPWQAACGHRDGAPPRRREFSGGSSLRPPGAGVRLSDHPAPCRRGGRPRHRGLRATAGDSHHGSGRGRLLPDAAAEPDHQQAQLREHCLRHHGGLRLRADPGPRGAVRGPLRSGNGLPTDGRV